jgi:hypothetical protein
MPRLRPAVLASLLILAPSAATAQVQFAISGFGGIYLPTSDLFDGIVNVEGNQLSLKFGQKTSAALGGRAAVWLTSRIGIEGEFAYAPSKVEGQLLIQQGGQLVPVTEDVNANVILGSLNLMYSLIKPPLEPFSVYVSGGVGFVTRGGDFYEILDDKSDVAGVLGLGFKYGVARSTWLRLDIHDYISNYQETALSNAAISGGDSKLQNDLLIVGAVEFVFGGS